MDYDRLIADIRNRFSDPTAQKKIVSDWWRTYAGEAGASSTAFDWNDPKEDIDAYLDEETSGKAAQSFHEYVNRIVDLLKEESDNNEMWEETVDLNELEKRKQARVDVAEEKADATKKLSAEKAAGQQATEGRKKLFEVIQQKRRESPARLDQFAETKGIEDVGAALTAGPDSEEGKQLMTAVGDNARDFNAHYKGWVDTAIDPNEPKMSDNMFYRDRYGRVGWYSKAALAQQGVLVGDRSLTRHQRGRDRSTQMELAAEYFAQNPDASRMANMMNPDGTINPEIAAGMSNWYNTQMGAMPEEAAAAAKRKATLEALDQQGRFTQIHDRSFGQFFTGTGGTPVPAAAGASAQPPAQMNPRVRALEEQAKRLVQNRLDVKEQSRIAQQQPQPTTPAWAPRSHPTAPAPRLVSRSHPYTNLGEGDVRPKHKLAMNPPGYQAPASLSPSVTPDSTPTSVAQSAAMAPPAPKTKLAPAVVQNRINAVQGIEGQVGPSENVALRKKRKRAPLI